MSLDAAAHLEQVKLARDKIWAALAAGEYVVEYEIRGRTVRRSDLDKALKEIRAEIQLYENIVNASSGRATNLAKFVRR